MLFLFALTLFVSATLLFLVEPMVGKMMLPMLGGTPAVWNTCMVFFQAALLAGYAYAHVTTTWLGVRRQALLHTAVLFLPFLFFTLPIGLAAGWLPPGDSNPIPWVLAVLTVSVGLPFFVLSASAPLLQKWFAGTGHPAADDPYFLYAASNVGSMIALLGYPTLIEPYLPLGWQSWVWAVGYGLLVLLTLGCGMYVWRSARLPQKVVAKATDNAPGRDAVPVTAGTRVWWVALAFVPSSLMLGVTTYLTTDIAAIPLLWVIPLALYLLSFIIVFARWPAVFQQITGLLMPVAVLVLAFFMLSGTKPRLWLLVLLHLVTLFLVSLACHGQLARSRPATRYLTEFYLWMSLGGVLGGLFNALVAPLLFNSVAEYPLALVLACLLLPRFDPEPAPQPRPWLDIASSVTLVVLSAVLIYLRWDADHFEIDPGNATFGLTPVRGTIVLACVAVPLLAYVLHDRANRTARVLDLVVAGSLGVLSIGLIIGLSGRALKFEAFSDLVNRGLEALSSALGRAEPLAVKPFKLKQIVMYALPPVLCYTLITRPIRFGLAVGAVFLAGSWCDELSGELLLRQRSFFGVLTVKDTTDGGDPFRELVHGTTLHGMQSLDSARRDEPLTYYHRTGPVGQLFEAFSGPKAKPHVALVGLGTGTLACYGEPGQRLTFYDIDPTVRYIARDSDYFTYLKDCKAEVNIVMGDARLRLKEAPEHEYGIIVLDAFSSDAIPVHLITLEAVRDVYLPKLTDDGILAFHISNRYLLLEPVLGNIAEALGLVAINEYDSDQEAATGKSRSHWVLLARHQEDFGKLNEDDRWKKAETRPDLPVWTDDFSNILSVFDRD